MKMVTVALAAAIIFTLTPLSKAATMTCEVVSITETRVELSCEEVKGLSLGDQVKIKAKKKSKAIEGC